MYYATETKDFVYNIDTLLNDVKVQRNTLSNQVTKQTIAQSEIATEK